MAITKPAALPRWGESAGSTGIVGPNEVAPNSAKQDVGFVAGEEPPAGYFDWLFRLIFEWCQYVGQAFFTADTGSGLPGATGTGDTNQPGLKGNGNGTGPGVLGAGGASSPGVAASAGGGGSPVTGALNLVPQIAPSAPGNGDLWATASALFARVAGATMQFVGGDRSSPMWLQFSGVCSNASFVALALYATMSTGTATTIGSNPTLGGPGINQYLAPTTGLIKGLTVLTGQLTAGAACVVSVAILRAGSAIGTISISIPAGTASGTVLSATGSIAFQAGDVFSAGVANGVGQTAGAGLILASVLIAVA